MNFKPSSQISSIKASRRQTVLPAKHAERTPGLPFGSAWAILSFFTLLTLPVGSNLNANEFNLAEYYQSGNVGAVFEYDIIDSNGNRLGSIREEVAGETDGVIEIIGESAFSPPELEERTATFSYRHARNDIGELHQTHFQAATHLNGDAIAQTTVDFAEPSQNLGTLAVGEAKTSSVSFTEHTQKPGAEATERNGTLSTAWTLEAFEEITVPAGEFFAARLEVTIQITYDDASEYPQVFQETTWGAEGIGVIKRLFTPVSNGAPVAHELTYHSPNPGSDDTSPPNAPTDLVATVNSDTSQIELSWNAPEESGSKPITGYGIERQVDTTPFVTLTANTGSQETKYADTSAETNKTYTYRVYAINEIDRSNASEPISITLSSSDDGSDNDGSNNDGSSEGETDEDQDEETFDITGLIAYYPLTEGTGNTAYDQSKFADSLDLNLFGGAEWLEGEQGIRFHGNTSKLKTDGPATKLYESISETGEFSVEIWARATNPFQDGPARLISYSGGTSERNFTLGHGVNGNPAPDLVFRTRTTGDGNNNGVPEIVAKGIITDEISHFVATFNGDTVDIFRDGKWVHTESHSGTLENWDPSYPLHLGNELGASRGWSGEIYQVAIYDRALEIHEIEAHFQSGYLTLGPSGGSTLIAQDIGYAHAWGSSRFDEQEGVFTLEAYGTDIWGRSDGFHFLHRELQGDGVIVARVLGIENGGDWAKAGVMIRESLDPDSKHVMLAGTKLRSVSLQRRKQSGDFTFDTTTWGVNAPVWVKLERRGNFIESAYSRDGVHWTPYETLELELPEKVYVGLVHSSGNNDVLGRASFDSVSFPGESDGTYSIVSNGSTPTSTPIQEKTPSSPTTISFASTGGSLNPVEGNMFALFLNRGGSNEEAVDIRYELIGPGAELISTGMAPASTTIFQGSESGIILFDLGKENFIPNDAPLMVHILSGDNYRVGSNDSVIFTIHPRPIDTWRDQHFSQEELSDPTISSDTASPAKDGVPNLLKYALGLAPRQQIGPKKLPALRMDGQNAALEFERPADLRDVRYIVEVSTDLNNWVSGNNHIELTITNLGNTERVVARDKLPVGQEKQRFMRLRIERR